MANDGLAADVRASAMLPARIALGSTMIFHGRAKLVGEGPEQTARFLENIGVRPAKPLGIATGLAEVGAGLLSILGIGTRMAALAVLATQAVAVAKVHWGKGFDSMKGGWEFNLALMSIAAALLLDGPGVVSAHELWERRLQRRRMRLLLSPRRRAVLRAVKLMK